MGEFDVAHVWFQCYEKGYFEKCPKQHSRLALTLYTVAPTHFNFVGKKSGFSFPEKIVRQHFKPH